MKRIFLFLLTFFVLAPLPIQAECKTKPPIRTGFEEMVGQPVECYPKDNICWDFEEGRQIACPTLPPEIVCYRKHTNGLQAVFDSENNLLQLKITGDVAGVYDLARKLIPESWANLWEARRQKKTKTRDLPKNTHERFSDDCIDWEYGTLHNLPTGYVPFWAEINWK